MLSKDNPLRRDGSSQNWIKATPALPKRERKRLATAVGRASPLFEIPFVFVRFDHVAGRVVNTNHSIIEISQLVLVARKHGVR
jgi:hypothetical protein